MSNGIISKRLSKGVRLFVIAFIVVVTTGYVYDLLQRRQEFDLQDYFNLVGIASNLVMLIYLFMKRVKVKFAFVVVVYILIFNSITSVLDSVYSFDSYNYFLRDSIFFTILIVFTSFIYSRYHALIISFIYIIYLVVFSNLQSNVFLNENYLLILIVFAALGGVMFFLKTVFDHALDESARLYNQLKKRNNDIQNQNETLKDQAFELNALNKVLLDKEELLQEQKEALKQANSTKDKLFSIVSHDLKNSVGIVQSSMDYMINRYEKLGLDKQKELLELVNNSINKLSVLLENLLHWSKSQANIIKFSSHSFNLYELSLLTIEPSLERLDKKNIKLKNTIPQDMEIVGDRNLLEIVMRNLIGNAVKYTPEGEEITISAVEFDTHVLVEIIDSGVGMEDADYKEVFNQEIGISTLGTDGEVGTGLGLSLCKEFIEMHNGKIGAKANTPKGSVFWFSVPKQRN